MLKRIILLVVVVFCYLYSQGQSNAFVLVDVSGSGPSFAKSQAREIVRDILNNQYAANKYDPKWEWSKNLQAPLDRNRGCSQPMLDFASNATLMIMPMGVKDRYRDYRISQIGSLMEVTDFFTKHYPTVFNDPFSYLEIAKAKAAGVAHSAGITNYYQIEITDALEDTQSVQPPYTQDEWDLIQSNTSSVSYLGELTYNKQNPANSYRIIFRTVNANHSQVPKTPIVGGVNVSRKEINIIKPRGTIKNPTIQNPGSVSISWQCLGCKDSTEFSITVLNTSNKKIKISPRKVKEFSATFVISEPGVYKVLVSGDGVTAKSVYFKIDGKNSGSGFLVFLLLALVGGAVWYFWNKRRNEQLDRDTNSYAGGMNTYIPPPAPPSRKNQDDDTF